MNPQGIPEQQSFGGALTQDQIEHVEQRTSKIHQIERTLNDISSLFKKFGTIVAQHQTLVERIDQTAEQSLYDIEGAKKELRTVQEDVNSNRAFILKFFFLLLLISTFYVLLS